MSEPSLKCLSVQQPWASLIIGMDHDLPLPFIKDVENRNRRTSYRGELLIHASKKTDAASMRHMFPDIERHPMNGWPLGVIVGVVELLDVVTNSESPWALEGQFHWILGNPRRFERPIPWIGALYLQDVPISVLSGQYQVEGVAL